MSDLETNSEDYNKQKRREKRIAEMKEEKRRYEKKIRLIKKISLFAGMAVIVIALAVLMVNLFSTKTQNIEPEQVSDNNLLVSEEEIEPVVVSNNAVTSDCVEADLPREVLYPYCASEPEKYGIYSGYTVRKTDKTGYIWDEDVISEYAILVDLGTGDVVAQKEANTRINPASMTKILTVLVAAENIEDVDEMVTVTIEATDYAYVHDLSAAGFDKDETVTVKDLMYGTILPSGGDAAYALAVHVAGSHENFVDMMNEKLKELGLSSTAHFTNCVGLYDENHYCTVTDMAMILKAAVENELCREVLSEHIYTTSATDKHPDGITLSNLFLRRIEDKDTHGEVLCAKTGFVAQSGNCAASYARSNDGHQYICVTGKSTSAWRCIYDHVEIYDDYTE